MPDPLVVAVVAVVAVDHTAALVAGTVASLRRGHPELEILLAGDPADAPATGGAAWAGASVASVANRAWEQRRCHVFLVEAGAELPDRVLDQALAIADADPRTATVSFFSDDAGFLTFPRSRAGVDAPIPDLDPDEITRTLRSGDVPLPSPIPFAAGGAVLVSSAGLSAIGPLKDLDGPDAVTRSLLDFSLRGRKRGFVALLDPTTFCRRRSGGGPPHEAGEPAATLMAEYESAGSPLSTVHAAARARVWGLHVLIDAARLTPQEMGTQVATVALIRALARRDDVARVAVPLSRALPDYAISLLDEPKVDARVTAERNFSDFGRVDIAHRPFQPDSPHDMDACAAVADRTAITVLDLIAYHAVSYQLAPADWSTYRGWLRQSMARSDGVIVPSRDVRHQVLLERLPVDPDRLMVAELGTDHLRGDEPEAAPAGMHLEGRGFIAVLGADYTHKNRDLAVRAHQELCRRGFALSLVMAGTGVHGSSRADEADARAPGQEVISLPEVSSEERNWMLRHAALVLYPTSGEGFGLVPFEAARFGTPSAFVPFGPLGELVGAPPVLARDWSATSLADAADRLLADPELARAQVEATLAAGDRLTWDATAAKLVGIYHSLLERPAASTEPQATVELGEAREQLQTLHAEHRQLSDTHDEVLRSLGYRLAGRASDLRDALRRRPRPDRR